MEGKLLFKTFVDRKGNATMMYLSYESLAFGQHDVSTQGHLELVKHKLRVCNYIDIQKSRVFTKVSFCSIQRCDLWWWPFPVVVHRRCLAHLIIWERWVELLDFVDHVIHGVVPDVVQCDVDRDPSEGR